MILILASNPSKFGLQTIFVTLVYIWIQKRANELFQVTTVVTGGPFDLPQFSIPYSVEASHSWIGGTISLDQIDKRYDLQLPGGWWGVPWEYWVLAGKKNTWWHKVVQVWRPNDHGSLGSCSIVVWPSAKGFIYSARHIFYWTAINYLENILVKKLWKFISRLPDIAQKCFCTQNEAMDISFQNNIVRDL